jgi:hypothetical protein
MHQGGVPKDEEKIRWGEGARGSPWVPNLAGDIFRFAVLRQAIPRRPGDELERKQRERRAEALGYL